MLRSTKKLIILVLSLLLNSQIAFTQSRVLVIDGDTLICNSVEEQKFWVKQYYQVKELQKLDSVNIEIISKLDSNIVDCQANLMDKDIQLENTEEIVEIQYEQIRTLNDLLTEQKRAARREKILKWTALTIGTIGTSVMTYLYFTK